MLILLNDKSSVYVSFENNGLIIVDFVQKSKTLLLKDVIITIDLLNKLNTSI